MVWMLGYALEEGHQLRREKGEYFKFRSNQIDLFILMLQGCYVGLSISAGVIGSTLLLHASTQLLIVTTIISYVRLMVVFSISKKLGPLYVVLQRIVGDVFRWIFVFILFAIGFQVSFMALNQQLPGDDQPSMWIPTYQGGSFMGSFYAIIGELDGTMDTLSQTQFGAAIVSIYALISQIMLVNLLIAMMGDTFNTVKENSAKDWRFSRYSFIEEYTNSSFHPPPFNVFIVPIKYVVQSSERILEWYQAPMTKTNPDIQLKPQEQENAFLLPRYRSPSHPSAMRIRKQVHILTEREINHFKRLMQSTKYKFFEERKQSESKSLSTVSDMVRENCKAMEEDRKTKSSDSAKLDEVLSRLSALERAVIVPQSDPVGILVVLERTDTNEEYVIMHNTNNCLKLPTGTFNGGILRGGFADALKTNLGIEVNENAAGVCDMSQMVYGSSKADSPGLHLYLYRESISADKFKNIEQLQTTILKGVPLNVLYKSTQDSNAHSAAFMYHSLSTMGEIPKFRFN